MRGAHRNATRLRSSSVAQQKIADVGRDSLGRLDQDGVLEPFQDDELGVRKCIGNEPIEPRVAPPVKLARQYQGRCRNTVEPGSHFGLGVDAEDIHEHVGGGVRYLT